MLDLRLARIRTNILANSDKTLRMLIERILQRDDNALHVFLTPRADIVTHLTQIDVIEGSIDFVKQDRVSAHSTSAENNDV
jgi:hypothetical protein